LPLQQSPEHPVAGSVQAASREFPQPSSSRCVPLQPSQALGVHWQVPTVCQLGVQHPPPAPWQVWPGWQQAWAQQAAPQSLAEQGAPQPSSAPAHLPEQLGLQPGVQPVSAQVQFASHGGLPSQLQPPFASQRLTRVPYMAVQLLQLPPTGPH
jgi:hypothetical protein